MFPSHKVALVNIDFDTTNSRQKAGYWLANIQTNVEMHVLIYSYIHMYIQNYKYINIII